VLKLYNSLGRKAEEFRPIEEGIVKLYTCGPTVWNYAHIGNFRTFVFEDVLKRYLKSGGYRVKHVMNITDVEDKIIRGIKETGKPLKELTAFFEKAFMDDMQTLGVERADFYPRATEHISEMVALVKVLMEKGLAYRAGDGSIYFDVSEFPAYGALSGVKPGQAKSSGRVAQDHYEEKEEAVDFALWKAWDEADGEVFWETELGKGRPGWHLECSAMSMKYLGESFDIHAGGMDNKFPHHENEIAQSEGATGKKFVNYWLHSQFLTFRGDEMHKSVGNVVYLRDLVAKGWEPSSIRLFLISSRYRDPVDLTDSGLEQARARRERLQEFADRLGAYRGPPGGGSGLADELREGFAEAMDDDLNTPQALAVISGVARKANGLMDSKTLGEDSAKALEEALWGADAVLGVLTKGEASLPEELASLVARREEARGRGDYAESDRLRKELLEKGVTVEDTPAGPRWKRRSRG
jgi:cysteinyl-tRNA synthetase